MSHEEQHVVDFLSQAPSQHLASQASSNHGGSAGGFLNPGMEAGLLDLNSNVDSFSFPDLASYQQILQSDERTGHSLPPIPGRKSARGRGRSRSLNVGGGSGSQVRPFIPPGAAAGNRGSTSQGSMSQYPYRGGSMSQGAKGNGGGIAGRGFSMSQGAGLQRASSSGVPPEEFNEDEDLEDGDNSGAGGMIANRYIDKANWSEENIFVFCNIACEEARDGHYTNGNWTTRAYENMKEKYYQRASLLHTTKQLKNVITKLKSYYDAWVWLGKQTGCGRTGNGEITASNEWWKKRIELLIMHVS